LACEFRTEEGEKKKKEKNPRIKKESLTLFKLDTLLLILSPPFKVVITSLNSPLNISPTVSLFR
jgi:hypothetical protein